MLWLFRSYATAKKVHPMCAPIRSNAKLAHIRPMRCLLPAARTISSISLWPLTRTEQLSRIQCYHRPSRWMVDFWVHWSIFISSSRPRVDLIQIAEEKFGRNEFWRDFESYTTHSQHPRIFIILWPRKPQNPLQINVGRTSTSAQPLLWWKYII